MSSFLEFLKCRRPLRADANLKAAIVAAGFIAKLALTR